jgi:hypothetical protein
MHFLDTNESRSRCAVGRGKSRQHGIQQRHSNARAGAFEKRPAGNSFLRYESHALLSSILAR